MKILDLGCDNNKYKGKEEDTVIGVDFDKYPDVDVVHDLEKAPLPFEDESFDMVVMNHVIEHINNRSQLVDEIWRVLKTDGKFLCIVPHHTNPVSAQLNHKITGFSFQAFDAHIPIEEHRGVFFETVDRKITLIKPFGFLNGFAERFPDFYEWYMSKFISAVEIRFELRKISNEKHVKETKTHGKNGTQ